MNLDRLAAAVRDSRGVAHKRDIDAVVSRFGLDHAQAIPVGDDCAAIPDGDGWLLFAIEGFMPEFVRHEPWFAGYCGVMVNLSDVAAMGGRAIAVVDALWSQDVAAAGPLLDGLRAGSAAYGVPIVGGHTNLRSDSDQLSVAVLGRAKRLLTSFDAVAGDTLLAAIDLRGRYREPYAYWDASTGSPPARLRRDLELLPEIAEAGWCKAAKDISMAGLVGTAMMLLEASGLGAVIDVKAVPRPEGASLERWLLSFPSFGYLLSVPPLHVEAVTGHFAAAGIACAAVGMTDNSGKVSLTDGEGIASVWDFGRGALIGCRRAA